MQTILSKETVVAIVSEVQKRSNQRNCSMASKLRALMFLSFFESHCSLFSPAPVHAHLVEPALRMKLQRGPAEGPCRKVDCFCFLQYKTRNLTHQFLQATTDLLSLLLYLNGKCHHIKKACFSRRRQASDSHIKKF